MGETTQGRTGKWAKRPGGETTRGERESGRNDSGANGKVGETTRIHQKRLLSSDSTGSRGINHLLCPTKHPAAVLRRCFSVWICGFYMYYVAFHVEFCLAPCPHVSSVLFSIVTTSLREERADLCASRAFVFYFARVKCCPFFLFLLISGVSCDLCLWHFLDLSINFFTVPKNNSYNCAGLFDHITATAPFTDLHKPADQWSCIAHLRSSL